MELYIEKEFLDNFYLEYNESIASESQRKLASILTEYGEVNWYIDTPIDSLEDLHTLKLSNPFFALRANYLPPVSLVNFREHILKNVLNNQCLIFTAENKDWFEDVTQLGALCFSFSNYESKINYIIKRSHFKIDLSENFPGWELFKIFRDIPFNKLVINDNYILVDKGHQSLDKNLVLLLTEILVGKREKVEINIFTKDLNPISSQVNHIKEAAKKRYTKLNSKLANYPKNICIYNNSLQPNGIDLHDRVLISNYLSIDSGKGFNLVPHKKSNSQIIVESIFDKYTYKRIKNHLKIYDQYIKKLETLETSNFVRFPS
jgi:hypothetical protein